MQDEMNYGSDHELRSLPAAHNLHLQMAMPRSPFGAKTTGYFWVLFWLVVSGALVGLDTASPRNRMPTL